MEARSLEEEAWGEKAWGKEVRGEEAGVTGGEERVRGGVQKGEEEGAKVRWCKGESPTLGSHSKTPAPSHLCRLGGLPQEKERAWSSTVWPGFPIEKRPLLLLVLSP